jgi:coatomer subunit beta'
LCDLIDLIDQVLPTVPKEQRTRVAHYLEKQGFKKQALAVSTDPEHRFDLAIQLGDLEMASALAKDAASEQKWKQLAELATSRAEFGLAQHCLHEAQDHGGLLLLATAAGNAAMVGKLGAAAEDSGKHNVSFLSYFLLGQLEKCLEILIAANRIPEAAFFARTYLPSQVSRVVALWRVQLGKVSEKAGQSLADPAEYPNLFPDFQASLQAEVMLKKERDQVIPAADFQEIVVRDKFILGAVRNGFSFFSFLSYGTVPIIGNLLIQ